ncbi:MAG: BatD family protein [Candidatus Omnitrophica bacterium]|nr:BatD family protein [Candidatus Omnitrophota bacterium]
MSRFKIIGCICFLLMVFSPAFCLAQIEIKAEVDKKKVSTDEELVYKLIISSTASSIPAPEFPDFKDFYVISQANTSNITIKAPSSKITVIYVFVLVPKEAGKFIIEPSQIKTKSAIYKSESFEIEVVEGKRKFIPPESPKPPLLPQEGPKEKIIL